MDYRYQLAPYAGRGSRLECPNCHQREFVPYVDTETGEIIDETCGRCNRESHCGYHLTPNQYFKENPGARPQGESWREEPNWLKKEQPKKRMVIPKPQPKGPINEVPKELVEKCISVNLPNRFLTFLEKIIDPLIVEGLQFLYNIGSTKDGKTIFFQKDRQGRFRSGKIIDFDVDTGHRIKSADDKPSWFHTLLQKRNILPWTWKVTQCLFGEDLLDIYPDQDVFLVEAEKTAIICAGLMPEYLWVAVGGKNQFGDKLDVLRGRKFFVIPDVDAYDAWVEYFSKRSDLDAEVLDFLQKMATPEEIEAQIDIADLFIRYLQEEIPSVPSIPNVPLSVGMGNEIAQYFSPDVLPEVAALIEELDLEPITKQLIDN